MSENNGNKGANFGEEITKVLKMGVGAVAGAVEKGINYVEELTTEGTDTNKRAAELGDKLSKKGEEVFGKTVKLGSQLKDKVAEALGSMDFNKAVEAIKTLSDEELTALKEKIDELLDDRAADKAQAEAQEPADEAEESEPKE